MGSSVMGASILKKKIKEAGLDIPVDHISISNLKDMDSVLLVTQQTLYDRVHEAAPNTECVTVNNFLSDPMYDEIVNRLKK